MDRSGVSERTAARRAPEGCVTALPTGSGGWLAALCAGEPILAPAVIVVAHPDDETAGLGARLALFRDATLVHATDGAPADGRDARRLGFPDAAAYARARAAELEAALAALGARPRRIALGLQDQAATLALAGLTRSLCALLQTAEVVVTHAYEGGHPDHDACAFAVQGACARIEQAGGLAPARLEFAGYHKAGEGRAVGRFWPDRAHPPVQACISPAQLACKRAAFAAHRTQAEVLAWFDPGRESYRTAPRYTFIRPPPPGAALYDAWGLALSSATWRDHARAALAELALEPAA